MKVELKKLLDHLFVAAIWVDTEGSDEEHLEEVADEAEKLLIPLVSDDGAIPDEKLRKLYHVCETLVNTIDLAFSERDGSPVFAEGKR